MKRLLFLPLFTLFTLAFSMSPWFIGVLATPGDRVFGGVNRFSADYYIYLSFVETGIRGQLKEFHLTTTKPQEPIWIHGIYTLSGLMGRVIGLDVIAVYHLDRLVLGGIFIVSLYFFYKTSLGSRFLSAIALFFTFWITGFPKTLDSFGRWDARYLSWIQEMNIVGRSTSPPHYLLGFCLFIFTLWYFMASEAKWWQKGIVLGLLATVATIANPVNLLILWGVMVLYTVVSMGVKGIRGIKGKGEKWAIGEIGMVVLMMLGSLPIVWYYQQKLSIFPWGPRSNALKFYIPGPSIDPKELILALGPMLILAVVGVVWVMVRGIREIGEKREIGESRKWIILFLSWIVVQFGFLAIAKPWGVDPLRFLQGLYYIPLAGFAAWGVERISGFTLKNLNANFSGTRGKIMGGLVFLSMIVTIPTLILSYREQLFMNTDYKSFETMIYPTKYQYQAYKFMEKNTPFRSGVLAYYEVTEVLPAFSGNATERDMTQEEKNRFFNNQLKEKEAKDFLQANGFSYVWLGYQERWVGFNPRVYPFLQKIFENPEVTIYQAI